MKTLKNWRARRSSGKMTVYGEDADTGKVDKITRVDTIKPGKRGANCVIAIRSDNTEHHLLLS